jgi:hypothetical protein
MKLMEPIQNPTQEPVQSPPINIPQTKPNYLIIVVFSILGIIFLTSTIFLFFQNQQLKKQAISQQVSPTIQALSPTPETVSSISIPPDETENWKKYTYDTFLIKLPPEWHTTQLNNPIQFLNYIPPTVGGDFDPRTDKGKLKIEVYKNKSSLSIREYVDSQKTGPLELGPYSETPIKIDGIEAVKVTTPSHGFSYYVKSGDYIYSLVFVLDFNNYMSLADQILSTFKFTEEKQTKVDCKNPRPEACTMECIQNPPYICGSDGKSYCTVCQACSNKDVVWYEMKASACGE